MNLFDLIGAHYETREDSDSLEAVRDMNRRERKQARRGVALAFVMGVLIGATIIVGYWHRQRTTWNDLLLGWVITGESSAEYAQMEDTPRSFDFSESTVRIETIGGEEYTCEYDLEREGYGYGSVTIHDYCDTGEDVALRYSIQPIVHIRGLDPDDEDAIISYSLAG